MAPSTYPIVDIHHHVGGLLGIPGIRIDEATPEVDYAGRRRMMDRFGIDHAVLMPGHSYGTARGLADTQAINDVLSTYQALDPQRFPAIVGTVEPRHGKAAAVEEIDRLHALGFKGVSWHHRMQGLPIDHPIMFDCIERMGKWGMVPVIHCYVDADFEAPWRLRRLAAHFPDIPFVALDSMTSRENFEQALAMGEVTPNIHFDTASTVIGCTGITACISRLGADRLMFGSNQYSMMMHHHLLEMDAMRHAGLAYDQYARVFGGNAKRVFGF